MNQKAQLTINRFRSIKNLEISNIGQFNLLIGKNNCGKSTVLEAMYMAAGTPLLPLYAINLCRDNNTQTIQNEGFVTLFNDFDIEKPVSVKYSDKDYLREITVSAVKVDRIPQLIMQGVPQELSRIGYYEISVKSNSFSKPYLVRYNQNGDTSESYVFSDTEIKKLNDDKSIRPVQIINTSWQNSNIVDYIDNLVVNKQKDELIRNLQKIDERIRDIQIGNNNFIYIDIGLSKLMPIQFIGLGARKFITIASIVSSQKDGVLLIDEFENGLHYETMDILWKAIVSMCRERNIQLFATTHSYECIESFVNATPDGNVYRIERKDDEHKAVRYNSEEAIAFINKRWEMR